MIFHTMRGINIMFDITLVRGADMKWLRDEVFFLYGKIRGFADQNNLKNIGGLNDKNICTKIKKEKICVKMRDFSK